MRKSFFCRQKSTFEKASRPVSRVLFFRQPSILVRCCQRHRATFSRRNEQPHGLCLSCFGWGLQGPATLPPQRWALTPPFHPYRNEFGGLFLLHYPWSRLHRPLAGILPCGARTFLIPLLARDRLITSHKCIIAQKARFVKGRRLTQNARCAIMDASIWVEDENHETLYRNAPDALFRAPDDGGFRGRGCP